MTANQIAYHNMQRQRRKDEADIQRDKIKNAIEVANTGIKLFDSLNKKGHDLASSILGAIPIGRK